MKKIHLRTARPEFSTNLLSCGEVAFCNKIGKHFTKDIKQVTCKSCLKAYDKMKKYLSGYLSCDDETL